MSKSKFKQGDLTFIKKKKESTIMGSENIDEFFGKILVIIGEHEVHEDCFYFSVLGDPMSTQIIHKNFLKKTGQNLSDIEPKKVNHQSLEEIGMKAIEEANSRLEGLEEDLFFKPHFDEVENIKVNDPEELDIDFEHSISEIARFLKEKLNSLSDVHSMNIDWNKNEFNKIDIRVQHITPVERISLEIKSETD